MKLIVRRSKLAGKIAVPGSKSHTIRAIVAALQGTGVSIIRAPLDSEDTRSVLNAAKAFGATVIEYPDRWEISGMGGKLRDPGKVVDMGNSGTGLRMLTALAALQDFPITFDGDASLRTRIMSGLFDALAPLGVKTDSANGHCPFTICGPVKGGKTSVEGKTSQYLTSLLFALPAAGQDSEISLEYLFEQPYVNISAKWLDYLGIKYCGSEDMLHWQIPGNQKFPAFDKVIPADFSTACFPLFAAMLAGGDVEIRNLDFSDAQGDKKVFDFALEMGAQIERTSTVTTVCGGAPLRAVTLDLNATPDALPVIAAAAALIPGETRLINVAQARLKETDRITAMAQELAKMQVKVTELPDGLIIYGTTPRAAVVDSHKDHRLGMALAILALSVDGETVIENAEAIAVTYPDFIADFRKLGADFTIAD